MAERIGQQLGNYRLVRLLGRGGFAEVYLGEHTRLGTQAAIKVLHTQLANDEENIFQQEARTIAVLEHPHIVRVLDFDVQEGTPFLVMQYAPNGTLRTRHPRGSQLALETLLPYIKQVAEALAYAHDEKLIHRDVKPENMLLGKRGEVLLSDFGIATVAQSSRYQGTQEVAGTVAYMAPEQVQGKPRPASDQYALAITVYEWLTGTRPFHGSFTEIATQHVLTPPPPLSEKVPTISPSVEQAVLIALAKDPKERFASVQAFATALQQAALLDTPTQYVWPSAPLAQAPTIVVPPKRAPGIALPQPAYISQPAQFAQPIGTLLLSYRRHIDWVNALAWAPDGQRIASGSRNGTVQIWNAESGTTIIAYRGHTSEVRTVSWSPDEKYIASGGADQTAQVWETATGTLRVTYRNHSGAVGALAWAPDGQHIVSGSEDKSLQIWDAMTGSHTKVYSSHTGAVCAVAWSPDGKQILSAAQDRAIQKWNAATGGSFIYQSPEGVVRAVGWSPNNHIVSAGEEGVRIWEASTGKTLREYKGHIGAIYAAAWSPDGARIASGGEDSTVQIWDAATGNVLCTYRGHSAGVLALAWSPDGTRIASAGKDETVQVWRAS